MTFQEQINIYIEKLPCTSKELSAASELSAAVISRYRSGEREPASDSEQLQKLAAGITRLAAERNISDLTDAEEVLSALQNSLEQRNVEYDNFVAPYTDFIQSISSAKLSLCLASYHSFIVEVIHTSIGVILSLSSHGSFFTDVPQWLSLYLVFMAATEGTSESRLTFNRQVICINQLSEIHIFFLSLDWLYYITLFIFHQLCAN